MHVGASQSIRRIPSHPECEHCGKEHNPREFRQCYLAYQWDSHKRYRLHYYCSVECAKYYMTEQEFYRGSNLGAHHQGALL